MHESILEASRAKKRMLKKGASSLVVLLGSSVVGELDGLDYGLAEVDIVALEGVHDESVLGVEVHPPSVVDDSRLGNLHEPEELLPPELDPVRTRLHRRRHGRPSVVN